MIFHVKVSVSESIALDMLTAYEYGFNVNETRPMEILDSMSGQRRGLVPSHWNKLINTVVSPILVVALSKSAKCHVRFSPDLSQINT